MPRFYYTRPLLALLLLGIVLNAFGQDTQKLAPLLKALESASPIDRFNARIELKKHLENNPEKARPALVQTLITSLSSRSPQVKSGICGVLSSLNFFWTATNQEAAEKTLYEMYQAETTSDLKMTIDTALMRAKGLYSEAMDEFNNNHANQTVADKFKRVYEKYPLSQYASQAHFFLGQYYLRIYAVLVKQGFKPKLETYVTKSNAVFQEFLEKTANTDNDLIADAHYFSALNWVALNQVETAIGELKQIENTASVEAAEKVYISDFFYMNMSVFFSGEPSKITAEPPISLSLQEKFLDAKKLAGYTRQYLETNQNQNFKESANLLAFGNYLNQFKE